MWKGLLLLYALGAGPTDQPITTTGWGATYSEAGRPTCQKDIETKAAELNAVYEAAEQTSAVQVGSMGRWVGACVRVK